MADSNKKPVVVQVGETEFKFKVGLTEFTAYQNEFMPNNKVAPSENFLTRCVQPDQKEKLAEYCDQGLAVELASAVATEFKPEVEITVKK